MLTPPPSPEIVTPIISHLLRRRDKNQFRFIDDVLEINDQSCCILSGPPCIVYNLLRMSKSRQASLKFKFAFFDSLVEMCQHASDHSTNYVKMQERCPLLNQALTALFRFHLSQSTPNKNNLVSFKHLQNYYFLILIFCCVEIAKKQTHQQNTEKPNFGINTTTLLIREFVTLPSILVVNNIELDSVTNTKCLGVIIDNTLSFKFHVDSVVNSMQQKLGMIRRVKHLFTSSQLSTLYWGFVLPHAMYCSIVWSSRSESNYKTINKLHKRAAYIVSGYGVRGIPHLIRSYEILVGVLWKNFLKVDCLHDV